MLKNGLLVTNLSFLLAKVSEKVSSSFQWQKQTTLTIKIYQSYKKQMMQDPNKLMLL